MNTNRAVRAVLAYLLAFTVAQCLGGCRWASGAGDTVESPPRAAVEKSFHGGPPNKPAEKPTKP